MELARLLLDEQRYLQYLPTVIGKLERLVLEQNRIGKELALARVRLEQDLTSLRPYVKFFAGPTAIAIRDAVVVDEIKTTTKIVAGVLVKSLLSISFKSVDLPYFRTPPWLRRALPLIKAYLHGAVQVSLLHGEQAVVEERLRQAQQQVNRLELMVIPKIKDSIALIKLAQKDEDALSLSRMRIAQLKRMARRV